MSCAFAPTAISGDAVERGVMSYPYQYNVQFIQTRACGDQSEIGTHAGVD